MQNLRFTLALLWSLCAVPSWAQRHNITLEGNFADGAGRRVMLYGYADPLSQREILLDSTTIDSAGHLQLSFYANYPRLVVVQVETYSQSFYAEPGRTYHMHLDNFDWTLDEQHNVYLDPVTLPIRFSGLPDDELNLSISAFDRLCDSVVLRHRTQFDQRYRPDRTYFDTLRHAVAATRFANTSTFFERYRTYKLAQLELQLRITNREQLYSRLLADQPLPYHDENYMQFFFSLFDHCITSGSRHISIAELNTALASGKAAIYLDLLGHHPLLRNERVRELVAIQSLHEMHHQPLYFSTSEVLTMLHDLSATTKFEEHRTLVDNLLVAMQPAASAATGLLDLYLPDEHRRLHALDSLRGQWIYIAFVRVDDPNSVGELRTMAHFRDTVYSSAPDSIAFLTIVCDREPQKMYHFLHNNLHSSRYNWLFVHFNAHYDLLYRLGVTAYPSFILIAPDGSLYSDTAPWPASGYLLRGPWWPRNTTPTRRLFEF
ncbi:MAG: hypothetical protein AUK63_589 [bacterium P3]|nr:MAG: hypothetical protein AUK63_589 [bacterium P3]KWW42045.1 MAG: hypothetical protein F083_696 [bacterium F083]